MGEDGNLRLDHQLCVALYNASRAIVGCYRPLLDELGVTYSQYTVLLVLWERESATVGELGAALHLDSATMSPLLKRLERRGLVDRTRGVEDERTVHVSITEMGRALQPGAGRAQQVVERRTGLSGGELADLREQLHVLTERLRGFDTTDPVPAP